MSPTNRARGALQLVFDTVDAAAELVHDVHRTERERILRHAAHVPAIADNLQPIGALHAAGTDACLGAIRTVTRAARAVSSGVWDAVEHLRRRSARRSALARRSPTDTPFTPMSDAARGSAPWWRDHVEATLNAFWGDHLERTGNPLDIGMAFYLDGVRAKPSVVAARAGQARRLTVFVHGLGATEWCWTANAQVHWGQPEVTFGTRLADDLGHAPVYVRYNTGRSVVANAGALSDALQALVEAFPDDVTPEIALVGHSMGGLVARRAADSARQRGAAWRNALTHVVTIGSPIHGAPLAKAAELGSRALLTLGMGAAIAGHVLDRRSQGVRDLYSGERHDPVVLDDVESHAIASTITNDSGHPVGWLVGDLMVRVPSALADGESTSLVAGLDHLGIANHPAIYDALLDALRSTCD